MNLFRHELDISQRQKMVNITSQVLADIRESGVQEGICVVYCTHTTAGITVNENADPDVCRDMIYGYEKVFPTEDREYLHYEGNSHAHMKSTAFGASQSFIITEGKPILGVWQGIYFSEFDGPRHRKYFVKIIEG